MELDEPVAEKEKNNAGIKQYYVSKVEELEVGSLFGGFMVRTCARPLRIYLFVVINTMQSLLVYTGL